MAQKQKAVVLFSGGVDSTTCLALAIERFGKENVVPLSIQYGQKHSKELEAAANVLAYYGIEGKTMDVTKLFAFSNSSLLKQSTEDVPTGSYKEQQDEHGEGPVSTYVPFRNGTIPICCGVLSTIPRLWLYLLWRPCRRCGRQCIPRLHRNILHIHGECHL